jgi:uncharacterized protein (TIGR00251 family)
MHETSENKTFFVVREKDILLRVKAKPGAREDAIVGVRAGELLVHVRAVAEKGKANDGIARLLSKRLGVPKDEVVLKTGAGSPHKLFEVPFSARGALEAFEAGR